MPAHPCITQSYAGTIVDVAATIKQELSQPPAYEAECV